jgi:hypothetical protein
MATAQETRSMELEGSLKAFKFPEILQFLGRGQMTGILSLRRDSEEVRVSFREGHIMGASSSARTVRIGEMLLYAGKIGRQALDEALEAQEAAGGGNRYLGDLLIQRGLVSAEDLRSFIELQIKEEVWDLFNWEDGSFRFEQSKVRRGGAIEIKLDVEPLLLEGSRRLDEWQAIRSNIGGGGEVFRVNPDLAGPPDMDMDFNTWKILSLVNGRLTVDSIVRLSTFGKFDTYYALDSLLRAGVIASVPEAYDAEGVAARRRRSPGASAPGARGDGSAAGEARSVPSLLGLFGRRRGGPPIENGPAADPEVTVRPSAPSTAELETDVAVGCAAVNLFFATLRETPSYAAEGDHADWFSQAWRELEQRYPRADLIRVKGHHLDASRYDRYARLEGSVTDALRGCHEDCMEALRAMWRVLLGRARERMDAAAADRIADQCLQGFMQLRPTISAPDFSLVRWTRERR